MKLSLKLAAPVLLALAAAACNGGGSYGVPSTGSPSSTSTSLRLPTQTGRPACPGSRTGGLMQCDALIEQVGIAPAVAGWAPIDFQTRYNLTSLVGTKGKGEIVAIVDAYDNPNVATDLATYRTEFGLGTANFTKYNQKGQKKSYPQGNKNWGVEIDLDVQMVSAVCPNCTIDLIEADNNGSDSLYTAEREAVKLHAHVVSNSWGGGGGSPSQSSFDKPGVAYLASAGDHGYGSEDPADFDNVVSVGGTILSKTGSTYSEAVWPSTAGGCSTVSKPSWQTDPKCSQRTQNDVSAVAAGVAEYDSYGYPGWITIGGTSVASPMIGGVFGLAGNASKIAHGGKQFWTLKKKKAKDLNYISSGELIHCPSEYTGTYICEAGTNEFGNYSGPAGWGTPNGIGAF